MPTAIEFENISKQYRLGLVSTKTLSHDIRRFWITNVLGKEDPYLKIGETNDRSTKGSSEYVWALRDINFKVEQGDVVGIIGKNGAGKSTLLKLLSKVTGPTTGVIRARGRIGSLLEVGTGFHSEMTGRENIFLNGAILGMTKQEIARKLDEIVEFSGCERYIDTPVKRYSSGMMVRLGFAVAAHLDPEILVVDEVLAVGDAEFQKKAIGKMQDVSRGEGRTVLFVSHNMASIRTLCKHGIMLKNGMVSYTGDVDDVVGHYLSENDNNLVGISLKDRTDRKGNRKAMCTSFEMIVDDKTSTQVLMDHPFSFRIRIYSEMDFNNITIMYSVYNPMGVLVLSSNSRFSHKDSLNLKKGMNCFHVNYSNLPISPGFYKVNVRIWDEYEKDLDWIESAFSFEVVESDIYHTGRFYKDSSSLVILPHTWIID